MIVILCEKPSVARDIAKAFQQVKPQEGYYLCAEGSKKYAITWAYGHLFEIDEKILPEKWILSDLPIFPEEFKYVLIE
ncbi:MAG: type IA DNA topoisomerase, partial [Candidatus Nanoarchaeia archaeon]